MKVFNKGQVEKTIIGAKPKFALEQDLEDGLLVQPDGIGGDSCKLLERLLLAGRS